MGDKIVYLSGDWYPCGRKLLLTNAEMPKHQTSKLRQTNFNRGTLFKTHCATINAQFLLCCFNTFLTEALGRSHFSQGRFPSFTCLLRLWAVLYFPSKLAGAVNPRERRTKIVSSEADAIVSRVSRPNRWQIAQCAWYRFEGKVSLQNWGYFSGFSG